MPKLEPMTAWNLCGNHDWIYRGQKCRIKGGRVWYEDARNTKTDGGVILARLEFMPDNSIRQIIRWVHPDTKVELSPITATEKE
jgi:hypothetical protein